MGINQTYDSFRTTVDCLVVNICRLIFKFSHSGRITLHLRPWQRRLVTYMCRPKPHEDCARGAGKYQQFKLDFLSKEKTASWRDTRKNHRRRVLRLLNSSYAIRQLSNGNLVSVLFSEIISVFFRWKFIAAMTVL